MSQTHTPTPKQTLTHFWSSFDIFHFLIFTLVKEWHCMILTFSLSWYYGSGCARFRSVKEKLDVFLCTFLLRTCVFWLIIWLLRCVLTCFKTHECIMLKFLRGMFINCTAPSIKDTVKRTSASSGTKTFCLFFQSIIFCSLDRASVLLYTSPDWHHSVHATCLLNSKRIEK